MNEQDHLRFEDDLAAYMLDALPGDEKLRFERHLDGCQRCQERARWLKGSVEMLPAAVEQVEPPPALRERLMATVRAEAEQPARPAVRAGRRRSWRDLFAIPRPALALAATLLVAVAVGAYAIGAGGGDNGTETVTAQGQAPPGATASVERTGDSGILRVSGLPQRTDGIYEVWIERDGQVVPSTLFQVHRNGTGAAGIPDGLEAADRVMVTLEPPGRQHQTEPRADHRHEDLDRHMIWPCLEQASVSHTDTPAALEQAIERYNEAWNDHDVETIMAMHAPDMVFHNHTAGESVQGDDVRSHLASIFETWPDIHFETRRLYVRDGLVVQEWTATATHTSTMRRGDLVAEPTGRRVTWDGMDVIPFEDGLVKRKDVYSDSVSILRQVGLLD